MLGAEEDTHEKHLKLVNVCAQNVEKNIAIQSRATASGGVKI